jgi:hypothetical protein
MSSNCSKCLMAGLLILTLILAGCENATPGGEQPPSTVAQSVLQSPLASPTAVPTFTPKPAPTPEPSPILAPASAAVQLTLLHTNDNWGETEPCG